LAGRSGRSRAGGKVIVQTLAPGSPSISHAATHDSAGFLAGELDRRRELGYPPFSHLIRIQLAAEVEADVESAADLVLARLDKALPAGAEQLGPAPMFRARNRYRRRILIRSTTRADSIEAVHATIEDLLADRSLQKITLAIDVDPQ
jgi:primosomal protein N' (replication factor Y)